MKPLRLGGIGIERVVEYDRFLFDLTWLYPEAGEDLLRRHLDWLGQRTVDLKTNKLILSMHAYLIRTRRSTMLVDTCLGNHKRRPSLAAFHDLEGPFLENLAAAGCEPGDVDVVLCTHLHADHVGWNTRLDDGAWVPTFPNARYLFGRREFDHWMRQHQSAPSQPVARGSFEDSVLPIVDAGLAEFVDANDVLEDDGDERIWLEDAAGHTPGQIAVHVCGGGREAVLIGDSIHHPLGIAEPQLVMSGDVDPPSAIATRRRLIESLADTERIVLSAHFPAPTAATLVSTRHGLRVAWFEE